MQHAQIVAKKHIFWQDIYCRLFVTGINIQSALLEQAHISGAKIIETDMLLVSAGHSL